MSTNLKKAGFVLLVFAVGVAGVVAGGYLRDNFTKKRMREVTQRVPESLLKAGMRLPTVELAGADNALRTTNVALGDDGGVVLFLDLECPPCIDMCLLWEDAIARGVIDAGDVIGVTNHPVEVAADFAEYHALSFVVYQDREQAFRQEFEVTRFPLEVIVSADGRIRSTSYDSGRAVDADVLYGALDEP